MHLMLHHCCMVVGCCVCIDAAAAALQVLASASQLANRSPKEIVHLLEVNPSATLTASGAIVFGCGLHPQAEKEHHHHAPPDTPHPPKQQQHQPAVPASQPHNQAVWDEADTSKAFKLHSRPSATKKIFLEFQGCVTEVCACVCVCAGAPLYCSSSSSTNTISRLLGSCCWLCISTLCSCYCRALLAGTTTTVLASSGHLRTYTLAAVLSLLVHQTWHCCCC